MNKLRQLFLDENHQRPVTRNRNQPANKSQQKPDQMKTVLGVAGAVAFGAFIFTTAINNGAGATKIIVDPLTLCPLNESFVASQTYIHIDLSEPLTKDQRDGLKDLIGVATNADIKPRALISISNMQAKAQAPRSRGQKFCMPDIKNIGKAGKRIKREDCDAIAKGTFAWDKVKPPVAKNNRAQITNACKTYVKLQDKIKKYIANYEKNNPEQRRSFIVSSIEHVWYAAEEAQERKIPVRLIMFSDMLQHAKWFSQYRTKRSDWTVENLNELRAGEKAVNQLGGDAPQIKFDDVLICYLSSTDRHVQMDDFRNEKAHKKMWEDYFNDRTKRFTDADASACAIAAKELMQNK